MVSAIDVAAYILEKLGRMSAMKLQKLVYYSQAWHLVWDSVPLFYEPIEAWRDGPVVRKLWEAHRGEFVVSTVRQGDATKLTDSERETVDEIMRAYGHFDGVTLSTMTHDEDPWRIARDGLAEGESSSEPISHDLLVKYYGSL